MSSFRGVATRPILGRSREDPANVRNYETDSVIQFEPNTKRYHVDQLNKAGDTILQLLHRAAGVAEDNSRHAKWLRSFRINYVRLKSGSQNWKLNSTAIRAEQWLHRVYTEIEDRF